MLRAGSRLRLADLTLGFRVQGELVIGDYRGSIGGMDKKMEATV